VKKVTLSTSVVRQRPRPHVADRLDLAISRDRRHFLAERDSVDVVQVLDVAANLRRIDM
jgi:hypothetical protein